MKKLNELFEQAYVDKYFLSGSYGLVIKDKVAHNYFGIYDEVQSNKINEGNLFDCASLSKVVVTTTLLLQLLEKNKINLDDKISNYLPKFKHTHIKVFDILTHTSKLPADVTKSKDKKTKQEVMDWIYAAELLDIKDGSIVYSDVGFILLGLVIETIENDTIDNLAKNNIFKPLQMVNSTYNPKDKNICALTEFVDGRYTQGKVHDEKGQALGGVAGHAGLFSNVSDITNFITMILNDGVFNDKVFLKKETLELLYTIRVKDTVNENLERTLGYINKDLGLTAGSTCSDCTLLHTGFTGCNLFIDKKNTVGFVLLSNRVYYGRHINNLIKFRPIVADYIYTNLIK